MKAGCILLTFLIVQPSRAPHRTLGAMLSVRDSINSQRVYRAMQVTAIHKTFMTPAYPRPNNNIKMHFINCTCQLAISAQLFFMNNLLNYSFSIISLAIQCVLMMALAGSSLSRAPFKPFQNRVIGRHEIYNSFVCTAVFLFPALARSLTQTKMEIN